MYDYEKRFPFGAIERHMTLGRVRLDKPKRAGSAFRDEDIDLQMGAISGYGAVYFDSADKGTQYSLYGDLVERIMPGAFDRALRENQDVLCLFNHNPDLLLGRTSAGTCRCYTDKRGLVYQTTLNDTSIAHDVRAHIQRGDCHGSSFAFLVKKQAFIDGGDGPDIREIYDVDLFDVSPVASPAYQSTTAKTGTSPRSKLKNKSGRKKSYFRFA